MSADEEDLIEFAEDAEIEWRRYFTEFREKVWPMMEEQGLSFPEAYLGWRMERLITVMSQVRDLLEDR